MTDDIDLPLSAHLEKLALLVAGEAWLGVYAAKLERIRDYGRRGDWDGLREYVELNLLAEETQ